MIRDALIIIPNLSNEDQVCDFLFQTAKRLAVNNLVFVPTFSFDSKGYDKDGVRYLRFFQILPLKRFKIVNYLNKLIYLFLLQLYLNIKFIKYKKRYIWMFFPEISEILHSKLLNWKVIFDIVDLHSSKDEEKKVILTKSKKYLLEKSDYVFSISSSLRSKYLEFIGEEKINFKKQIELVPQGFALDDFSKLNKITRLILSKDKPIIGFIGQISERIDFELIKNLVKENKKWNFVFIGPWHHESNVPENPSYKTIFNKICEESNFFYYGKQPKKTICSIIEKLDVCVIPYDVSFDFNKYSYPMKIFEYFYVGKPVLSTRIKELERFGDYVKIGDNHKDWQSIIKLLLNKSWPVEKRIAQKQIAIQNSWDNKLEKISNLLNDRSLI